MSNPRNGDTKPPCLPRNGLVKIPTQPNGLGSASITKGTPAVKNRLCQPSSVPAILSPALAHRSDLPIPSLASPLSLAALAGVSSPPGSSLVGLNTSEGSEQPSPERLPGSPSERQLAVDEKILNRLFWYFSACEKCVLAQVCKAWRRVLYQPKFWVGLTPVLHTKELYNVLPGGEKEFVSLQGFAVRGFDGFCLVGVSDLDICEFIDNYPLSKKGVKSMSLKRSTITDAGLEVGDPGEVTGVAETVALVASSRWPWGHMHGQSFHQPQRRSSQAVWPSHGCRQCREPLLVAWTVGWAHQGVRMLSGSGGFIPAPCRCCLQVLPSPIPAGKAKPCEVAMPLGGGCGSGR